MTVLSPAASLSRRRRRRKRRRAGTTAPASHLWWRARGSTAVGRAFTAGYEADLRHLRGEHGARRVDEELTSDVARRYVARLEAAGATLVEVELPCVGEVDRQAILPTELLDFLGEPSLSLTPTSHVATLPC